MEVRDLGTTGVSGSVLGFGLAAIGRPGYIAPGHDDDLAGRTDPSALEHHALDMLDAARSYGSAEQFLATWLESRHPPSAELTVGSKWGYVYTAGWKVDAEVHETKIHTRENLDRQYAMSAELLGRHLRLYQIHSATLDSGVLENSNVLGRLAGLSESGTTASPCSGLCRQHGICSKLRPERRSLRLPMPAWGDRERSSRQRSAHVTRRRHHRPVGHRGPGLVARRHRHRSLSSSTVVESRAQRCGHT